MFTKRSPRNKARVVGLDLDPSHVAAVEVAVGGHVSITKAALAMLPPGVLRDGEVTNPEVLTQTLRDMFEDSDLPKRVRIGIGNQRIIVRAIDVDPAFDEKSAAAAVLKEAPNHIPMAIEDAVIDHQVLGVVNTAAGPKTRVLIIAVRREMVTAVAEAATAAGLEVEGIDLSAFAMVRSLAKAGDAPRLFVNVAAQTNVAIAKPEGVLFARTSAGGLETLVHQLAERRSLTLEHARQWLMHVGVGTPIEQVEGETDVVFAARGVLERGVEQIADAVRGSLDYYRTQEGAETLGSGLVTGPVVAIPGFVARLGDQLRLPLESSVVPAGEGIDLGVPNERLAVAAGLAIEERNLAAR